MKYHVYVLMNENGESYKGMTSNLERRLKEHNSGKTRSTKNHKWKLVYKEELPDRLMARKREKYLKSAAGRKYLQKILAS